MDDFILEEKVRRTLEHQAQQADGDGLSAQRIKTKVYQRIEEESGMKKRNWKKVALAAAAICVLGSMTALALGRASVGISSSNRNDMVTTFAEAKSINAKMSAKIRLVEEFSNGYQFKEAVPTNYEEQDESGATVARGTHLNVTYAKSGMSELRLEGHPSTMPTGVTAEKTLTGEDGTLFGYSTLHNKFVPPDYEATDEDLRLQEEGLLNLAYGSDEIEEKTSQHVNWKQDGMSYMLFSFENTMSPDEMLQMAQEVAAAN